MEFVYVLGFFAVVITLVVVSSNRSQRKRDRKHEESLKFLDGLKVEFGKTINGMGFKCDRVLQYKEALFSLDKDNELLFFTAPEHIAKVKFSDIVSFEIVENIAAPGSNALTGAILFGVTGAVVGASMKSKGTCNKMQLRLTLNDIINPVFTFEIVTTPVLKSGKDYALAYNFAKEIFSILEVVQNRKKTKDRGK